MMNVDNGNVADLMVIDEGDVSLSIESYLGLAWLLPAIDENLLLCLQFLQEKPDLYLPKVRLWLNEIRGALTIVNQDEACLLVELLIQMVAYAEQQQLDKNVLRDAQVAIEILKTELPKLEETKLTHSLAVHRMILHLKQFVMPVASLKEKIALLNRDVLSTLIDSSVPFNPVTQEETERLRAEFSVLAKALYTHTEHTDTIESLEHIASQLYMGSTNLQQAAIRRLLLIMLDLLHRKLIAHTADVDQLLQRIEKAFDQDEESYALVIDVIQYLEQKRIFTPALTLIRNLFGFDFPEQAASAPNVFRVSWALVRSAQQAFAQQPILDDQFAAIAVSLKEAARLLELAGWTNITFPIKKILRLLETKQNVDANTTSVHGIRIEDITHEIQVIFKDIEVTLGHLSHIVFSDFDQLMETSQNQHSSFLLERCKQQLIKIRDAFFELGESEQQQMNEKIFEYTEVFQQFLRELKLDDAAETISTFATVLFNNYAQGIRFAAFEVNVAEILAYLDTYLNAIEKQYNHELLLESIKNAVDQFFVLSDALVEQKRTTLREERASDTTPLLNPRPYFTGQMTALQNGFPFDQIYLLRIASTAISKNASMNDLELVHIFAEEFDKQFDTLQMHLFIWLADYHDGASFNVVDKCLAEVKGSSSTLGAHEVCELCVCMTRLIQKIHHDAYKPSSQGVSLLEDILFILPQAKDAFVHGNSVAEKIKYVKCLTEGLIHDEVLPEGLIPYLSNFYWENLTPVFEETSEEEPQIESALDTASTNTLIQAVVTPTALPSEANFSAMAVRQADPIAQVFLDEVRTYHTEISHILESATLSSVDISRLTSAVHTIKGGAGVVHEQALFQLSATVESFLVRMRSAYAEQLPMLLSVMKRYAQRLEAYLLHPSTVLSLQDSDAAFLSEIDRLMEGASLEALEHHNIIQEIIDADVACLLDAEFDFEQNITGESPLLYLEQMSHACDQLLEIALRYDIQPLNQVLDALSQCYHHFRQAVFDMAWLPDIIRAQQSLVVLIDEISSYQALHCVDAVVDPLFKRLSDALQAQAKRVTRTTQSQPVVFTPPAIAPCAQAVQRACAVAQEELHVYVPLETEDPEILEIFAEEFDELYRTLSMQFNQCVESPSEAVLADMRRTFHTIKGSARMSKLMHLGELAHLSESIIDRMAAETDVLVTQQVWLPLLDSVLNYFAAQNTHLAMRQEIKSTALLSVIHDVLNGNIKTQELLDSDTSAINTVDNEPAVDEVLVDMHLDAHVAQIQISTNSHMMQEQPTPEIEAEIAPVAMATCVETNTPTPEAYALVSQSSLLSAVSTSQAETTVLANIRLNNTVPTVISTQASISVVEPVSLDAVNIAQANIERAYAKNITSEKQHAKEVNKIDAEEDDITTVDESILEVFLEEAEMLVEQIATYWDTFAHAQDPTIRHDTLSALKRNQHTLKGAARACGLSTYASVAHTIETAYDHLEALHFNAPALMQILDDGHQWLISNVQQMLLRRPLWPAQDILQQIHGALTTAHAVTHHTKLDSIEATVDLPVHDGLVDCAEPTRDVSEEEPLYVQEEQVNAPLVDEFTMVSVTTPAVVHQQTVSVLTAQHEDERVDDDWSSFIQSDPVAVPEPDVVTEDTDGWMSLAPDTQLTEDAAASDDNPFTALLHHVTAGNPPEDAGWLALSKHKEARKEILRIDADHIDRIINLANEDAIQRTRIQQEINRFSHLLNDMSVGIQRVTEQVRFVEGEIEADPRFRKRLEQSDSDEFDPLEMDQYGLMNQLSRSLHETVLDLKDFKDNLSTISSNVVNLLHQQTRVQKNIQDNLMRSRLVPFSRIASRLTRVVETTAKELNKQCRMVFVQADTLIDRTVLDRLVAPLEHILRNAIDHGVEMPDVRTAYNKPAQGEVKIAVNMVANDIHIDVYDDGKGLDIALIRQKAIEKGIISAQSALGDHELKQLIFHAGLSTASKVSQISGRGIGMDVVQTEIKLLGGVIQMESTLHQGTHFRITIPASVAVTDVLQCRVGSCVYLIQLSQVERIVTLPYKQAKHIVDKQQDEISVQDETYAFRTLHRFFGESIRFGQEQQSFIPLLLVRYEQQMIALMADQLIGSRQEVVMKPVGRHLAFVNGLSGTSIEGDGHVKLILDLKEVARALVRLPNIQAIAEPAIEQAQQHKPVVMVVDDSVTVRKVTTRLLERNGFDVITAVDGLDAVEKLATCQPDIMLLDVEMPRMDGFEVASQVRHHPVVADLPIIMITSRTGDKHREKAYQVGVNSFLGKPYQEAELLELICEILEISPMQSA